MFRKGTLLKIIAVVALVWLFRSFLSDTTTAPTALILILGVFLAALLLRKSKSRSGRNQEIPPSQRSNRKTDKHKSWISRIDQE